MKNKSMTEEGGFSPFPGKSKLNSSSFKLRSMSKEGSSCKKKLNDKKRHKRMNSNPNYTKEVLENIVKREKVIRARDSSLGSYSEKKMRVSLDPIKKPSKMKNSKPPKGNKKSNSRSRKSSIKTEEESTSKKFSQKEESYKRKRKNDSFKEISKIESDTSALRSKLKEKKRGSAARRNLKMILNNDPKSSKKTTTSKKKSKEARDNDPKNHSAPLVGDLGLQKHESTLTKDSGLINDNLTISRLEHKKLSTIYSKNEEDSQRMFIKLKDNGSIASFISNDDDNITKNSFLKLRQKEESETSITLNKTCKPKVPKINILSPKNAQSSGKLDFKKKRQAKNQSKKSQVEANDVRVDNSYSKISDLSAPHKKIVVVETPDPKVKKLHNQNPFAFREEEDIMKKNKKSKNQKKNYESEDFKKAKNKKRTGSPLLKKTSLSNTVFEHKLTSLKLKKAESENKKENYKRTKERSRLRKRSRTKEIKLNKKQKKFDMKNIKSQNEKTLKSILSKANNSPRKTTTKKGNVKFFDVDPKKKSGYMAKLKKQNSSFSLQAKNMNKKGKMSKFNNSSIKGPISELSDSIVREETKEKSNFLSESRPSGRKRGLKKNKRGIIRIKESRSLIFDNIENSDQDVYNPREGLVISHLVHGIHDTDIKDKKGNEFILVKFYC